MEKGRRGRGVSYGMSIGPSILTIRFPDESAHRYLILDRDAKFAARVIDAIKAMDMKAIRTAYQSPWQNGVAERWVASCRRDLLDHVIVLNEAHLRRLSRDYLCYYHADRTHDGLNKETLRGDWLSAGRRTKAGS